MKRVILSAESVFGMANLTPKRSGLSAHIWSDHSGVIRNKPDCLPRVKIGKDSAEVSVTIEEHPQILARSMNIKKSEMISIEEAIEYVGRNFDIFLDHYNDTDDSFDDEDLFAALRSRGEYK